ncbi:MAG: SDR family oxidoreductase [Kiritimatiellaeota bacterium]|nr:SDR family oxidoreductase [Kiritimatiellota bacterium]
MQTLIWDFSGQTAIVTGGTRGIGRAISEALLAAGARVFATYAGNEQAAAEFAKANAPAATRFELFRFDVADYAAVETFYCEIDSRTDSVEILVNNAGIRRDAVVGMLRPENWQAVIRTNLDGVFHMAKFAVHRMMQARYGRIVTITSPSGKIGFEGQANYAASKAGEVAFTRSLAREVARRGITANCVSPGFIDTDFIRDLTPDQAKGYRGMVPMRRFGRADEVAACVLFLASREAAYVNGATLEVTGGL